MSDKKNLAVEIKDLVVEFRTDDAIVQAVNGLDLEIERAKPWAWWVRPAQARRPQVCRSCD